MREQISARRCLCLPLGERVHADFRDDTLPWGEGRIELACVPVLPLGPRQLLALRVVTVEFPSRQVVAWNLVELWSDARQLWPGAGCPGVKSFERVNVV